MRREFTILLIAVAVALVFVYAQQTFLATDEPVEGVYFSPEESVFSQTQIAWFFVTVIALAGLLFFFWTLRQYQRARVIRR